MAGSLTDLLAGNNQAPTQGVSISNEIKGGVQAGVQLATAQEDVDAKKMKVTEQKMDLMQKQSTAMMNRTKAAMYAQSPAAFESIMKANENYANSINLPYNSEALRAAYKDPNLRLAAQKEINTVMSGGAIKNPQAVIDFFGSDSPAIFDHLQNASYAAGVKQKDQEFQMRKQDDQQDSNEKIAAIGAERAGAKLGKELSAKESDDIRIANRELNVAITPMLDSLENLNKTDDLLSGKGMSHVAAQRTMAMAFNKGALSESDAKLFQGNQALVEQFQQYVSKAHDGTLTEDNLKEFREIVKSVKTSSSGRLMATIESRAQSFSKSYPNIGIDRVRDIFTPHELIKFAKPAGVAPVIAGDPNLEKFLKQNNVPAASIPAATAEYYKVHPKPAQARK